MVIHPFHALLPDKSIIASPSSFAADAKLHFRNYVENGYVNPRRDPEIFAYQIKSKANTFRGLLATIDINEIIDGHVHPHENTLNHKEQTSMQLILDREAIIKPLLLTYEPKKSIKKIIDNTIDNNRPVQSFFYSNTKERHGIWPITDPKAQKEVQKLFKRYVKDTYIADGHHRVAVLQRLHQDKRRKRLYNYDNVVSALFDFDNLEILDYNRMIEYSDKMSGLELMAYLSHYATITPLPEGYKPKSKFEITFYMDSTWFKLEWKKKVVESYKSKVILDATILNDILLKKIMGIKNVESDQHIKYLTGNISVNEIENRVDRTRGSAAFCLYPVRMQELKKQADAGKTLPPKSTYFKPRLPNAFVSQQLKRDTANE